MSTEEGNHARHAVASDPWHFRAVGFSTIRTSWPILVGLLLLYVPTYVTLSLGPWTRSENAHGPIVLLIILWMFWVRRRALAIEHEGRQSLLGGILLALGLLLYILGRSQSILLLEVGSQIPVLTGTALIFLTGNSIRTLLLPIGLLVFLVPLPSFILDFLTNPLKEQVSVIVEDVLYSLNYPVTRDGVVLNIGPYQLMIADACSGIKSMFALLFMGILFMHLRGRVRTLHGVIFAASILPVAFASNVLRVTALTLGTYYLGDATIRNHFHDVAGVLELFVALILLFAVDAILMWLFGKNDRAPA